MQPDDRQEIPAFQCGEDVKSLSRTPSELDRLRRELAEAKEFRAILEGHLSAAIDDYNEARKAAFIEAAEIASGVASRLVGPVKIGPAAAAAMEIAATLRGKAEETGHE